MTDRAAPASLSGLLLTLVLTLACLIVWTWPLALQLSTHTVIGTAYSPDIATPLDPGMAAVGANDQILSIWNIAHNARALLRADLGALLQPGQCYPMPLSGTLNEHLIEPGLVGTPWWLISRDPIFTFNMTVATSILLGAAGMFLLVHRLGGNAGAAMVGALAFALAPARILEVLVHPAVGGIHWIPWTLWAFELVVARGTVASLAAFGTTLALAALVGSYPLLALAGVLGPYALLRILLGREPVLRSAARVAVGAAPALVVLATIIATYSRVHAQWQIHKPAASILVESPLAFLPGGELFAGLASAVGLIALLAVRTARSAAAGALLFAGICLLLLCTRIAFWPGAGAHSLYEALAQVLPVLGAVRVPARAAFGVVLCVQVLGALGLAGLMNGMARGRGIALACLLGSITVAELFQGDLSRLLYGRVSSVTPHPAALQESVRAALARTLDTDSDRAVLDLPEGRMAHSPRALLAAAYHGHPTSACYTSLVAPTQRAVSALARDAGSAAGVEELAAAGFGYIVHRSPPSARANPLAAETAPAARALATEAEVSVWELRGATATTADTALLQIEIIAAGTRQPYQKVQPPYEIDLEVTNRGERMWAAPPSPLLAEVELTSETGEVVLRATARGVLPLALGPGRSAVATLVMHTGPTAGSYRATLRLPNLGRVLNSDDLEWSAPERQVSRQ